MTPSTHEMMERMNGLTEENTTKRNRYEMVDQALEYPRSRLVRCDLCRKNL